MEEWRAIEGSDGRYEVSNTGKVRSNNYLGHGKTQELKQNKDRGGYQTVYLYFDGKRKFKQVHRLVAQAFIPNPEGKPQVNHQDGNKSNNDASNLEWSTKKENSQHATRTGLWNKQLQGFSERNEDIARPIVCINLQNGTMTEYETTMEARRATGSKHVSEVAKGNQAQSKGYVFYYADEYHNFTESEKNKQIERAIQSYSLLGKRRKRPIVAINTATGEEKEYESIQSTKLATGANGVLQVLQGKQKSSKGYTFKYAD